jgi:phage-related protein
MGEDEEIVLRVKFFRTSAGNEPVREWLKELSPDVRKTIGEDIKSVQFGWPLGMPLVKKIEPGLWEVRSSIRDGIVRILFTVVEDKMVLLHGFVKKSPKLPQNELNTARQRLNNIQLEQENGK